MIAEQWLEQHTAELDGATASLRAQAETVERWGRTLAQRLGGGGRLLAAGNGGSAAEAQHLTAELVGRFLGERRPFSAICLCSESSTVTALVNDYGQEEMFARQVEGHGRAGDVLVLLSTSGSSPNVLAAAERGRQCGLTVWGLTGPGPNPLADRCDEAICVDAPTTAAIQEGHLLAVHAICAVLDAHLQHDPSEEAAGEQADGTDALDDRADRPRVVVVGDLLLDVDVDGAVERLSPDAPVPVLDVAARRESPGGAGLAALMCAAGASVTLVAPVATDRAGQRLLAGLRERMDVIPLGHAGDTRRKVRLRTDGRSLLRVDEGGPGSPTGVPEERVRRALAAADAVLVSDYGAGTTGHPAIRTLLAEAATSTRVVWDPHPRGGEPVPAVTLATPNLPEARSAADDLDAAADLVAAVLRRRWQAGAVAVTSGADGAFLAANQDQASYYPARSVTGGDPCGAGDRFAATAVLALASGALVSEAVERAVADASDWVAAGGAEGFRRAATKPAGTASAGGIDGSDDTTSRAETPAGEASSPDQLSALAARLRADGGILVATGGCFDIVHAGHVATLQAARRLGDHLVVLMNSDASVTRLKGPGRPVVTAADRALVLAALDCVDAVVVFAEDDPRAALNALRPDVWAKGGDYGGVPLPEGEVVQRHGGRVVLLPYLDGRSSTTIIERSEQSLYATTGGTP